MPDKKDTARAILSYATPNPVGPYRLITPPSPDLGRKTQTPAMPIMGGALVNIPTPVMPTKQTTPVAPPMADKLVNVPKQQGRVVDANSYKPEDFVKQFKVGDPYTRKDWGGSKTWDELENNDTFWEGPLVSTPGEIDGGDMAALEDDIAKRGIRTPVLVDWNTKEVLNGHHRVVAARNVGVKIPVVFVNKPEGKAKNNGRK